MSETYPCKYDYICKQKGKFNPATTIPLTITGIDGKPKTIQKTNRCTHGGGCACKIWRRLTNKEIGWETPLPGRTLGMHTDLYGNRRLTPRGDE